MTEVYFFPVKTTSFSFFFFKGHRVSYGSSQAMGRIRATTASLRHSHSNAGSMSHLRPTHSSWQRQILNPLSEARDWTRIPMDTRGVVSSEPRSELRKLIELGFFHCLCSEWYKLKMFHWCPIDGMKLLLALQGQFCPQEAGVTCY